MSKNTPIKETPTIKRALWRKRWQAIAVVSLATFMLLSMIWPLATRGYESRAQIAVDIADHPQAIESFKNILDEVVRRNLSENALRSTLGQVVATMPGREIEKLAELPSIRPLVEVALVSETTDGSYVLNLKYSGNGTASEDYLLNVLTTNIARDFLSHPLASMGTGPQRNGLPLNQDFLATAQALNHEANAAINQLEQTVVEGPYANESDSPFMTASSRTNMAPSSTPGESVDFGKLREAVQGLTTMVETAHINSSSTNGSTFSVREVRSRPMKPIGCDPQTANLILLGLLSTLIGATVAFNCRPFDTKGFESIYSIPSKLGIPVAATLNRRLSAKSDDQIESTHWANALVTYSELFLFAVTIIVLGFCFANAEVRDAFTDNLFHGFSRIFWMFRN